MNKTSLAATRGIDSSVSTSSIQALVIYEDAATHSWAESALSKVHVPPLAKLKTTWWRLEDLNEPGVLAGAVHSAIRAHLVIVAVRGGGNFPLPFYIWASSWAPHRSAEGGSLIGLIGSTGEERARDYLAGLGRHAGMRVQIEQRALRSSSPRSTTAQALALAR